MAQRINEIHINNFKFFGDNSAPINVEGKNLLIYGENGSGKSSIFWALYTLLECANKEEDDIKKYFQKAHKDTLVNIYATPDPNNDCNSFVSVKLDDGTQFKISLADTNINTDNDAKRSNYSTDFINYKLISKTHDFKHSDDINLFSMFERFILPYVKFSPIRYWKKKKDGTIIGLDTENANEIWNFVKNGPQKNLVNIRGNPRYPYRRENQFKDYNQIVAGFEGELSKLITLINTNANPILKDNFAPNITFKLTFDIEPSKQKKSFYLTAQRFNPPVYKILLTVPEYEGQVDVINRPHSFLNEAKLTGIGLSIRLAVLQSRAEDAKIKALILDDLLISLDMVHREKMIDLIIGNYANNYQIIHFTHDKNLFELMKDSIKKKGKDADWKYLDIYEFIDAGRKKCRISDSKSYMEKAHKYFYAENDPDTAGNLLRKEAEKFCKDFMPSMLHVTPEGKRLEPNGLIINAINYARSNGLDLTNFNKLDSHRRFVFNVLSHDSYDVPRFRLELERCFDTLNELWKIKNKVALSSESQLEFGMRDNSFFWRVEFILFDDLRLIKEPNKESVLSKVKMNYKIFKDGNLYRAEHEFISIKTFYDRWFEKSDKTLNPDYWEVIKISSNGALLKTLREF